MKDFVKVTLIGGILFLLVTGIVLLSADMLQFLTEHVVQPVANGLDAGPAAVASAMAAVFVFLVCGAIVLAVSGLYRRLNGLSLDSFLNQPQDDRARTGARPVLAHHDGAFELGFLVDTLDDGTMVVHVGGKPQPKSSRVLHLPPDQVTALDVSNEQIRGIVRASGLGGAPLLRVVQPGGSG